MCDRLGALAGIEEVGRVQGGLDGPQQVELHLGLLAGQAAEHGIGQDLLVRLPGQKSQVEFDLMRSVKAALDPTDIFNPGKGAQTIERSTRSAARSGQDEVEA